MMFLVRVIDWFVNALRILAAPEARLLRAAVLVVLICAMLVGAAGLVCLLAQLPKYFASP